MQINSFVKQFNKYIQEQHLLNPLTDRLLLAVSGGVDSVVMAHLCREASIDFGIAHCNFKLRSKESDQDALFVKQLAENLGTPFYLKSFDTRPFAKINKLSIQKAARILRYEWFEQIRQEQNYTFIATAHHVNDSIESILMNLVKGCGIRGMLGVAPKQKALHVVRPLGFASKERIVNYAEKKRIRYREDSSNVSTKYTRNKIRHWIIPKLKALNPALEQTFYQNIQHFREATHLTNEALERLKARVCRWEGGALHIEIEPLRNYPARHTFLFELLGDFAFNRAQIYQIVETLNGSPGAVYYSKTHTLLRDRTSLILAPKSAYHFESVELANLQQESIQVGMQQIRIRQFEYNPEQPLLFEARKHCAYISLCKLQFPLRFRMWKEGDYFYPLGMKGCRKKISKLFKDLKINLLRKAQTIIVESNRRVVWVAPYRLDRRFRVNLKQKTKVLFMEMCETNPAYR